ncbi:hypothetical protein ABEG75_10370 [Pantoea agglomerans]|nr:hypothetical protein [Pantoea agglomerans]QAV44923.1 hypothetical protein D1629_09905 [Pantoea agglomerans]QAV49763.1 hypothetical protein D1628_10915 [Pantoea agglomerans]
MIKRNLGRMGETFFNNLCATVGLTCNGSIEDSTGWDYIVEYPHEYDEVVLADKAPASKEFKIQIKATDHRKRKLAITLSNLMRLCNTPLPSFILFLEYNNKLEPDDVFLVHISKDIIFDVLKSARENSLNKARKNFNKKTLTIKYDESNKLSHLAGDAFIKAIDSYIPKGMNEYVKEKQHQLKTLGYEKSWGQMKFKASTLSPENDVVSASLGWIDKIKVTDVMTYDTRFEILSEDADLRSPEAFISFDVKQSTDKGNITFTHLKSKKRLRFECELFFSQVSAVAPKQMAKFRVKTKSFDMLVALTGNSHYKFIDDGVRLSLFELRDAIIFRKWITSQESQMEIKIFSEKFRKSLVMISDKVIEGSSELKYIKHLESLEKSIVIASELAGNLNIESQVQMSFDELRNSQESLQSIEPLLSSNKQPYDIMRFHIDQEESAKKIEGEVVCIMVLSSKMGNLTIYMIISVKGQANLLDGWHAIGKPKVSIEELIDCPSGENVTEQIKDSIDSIVDSYSSEGVVTINFFKG